jgi:CheY-like chemotaxis protein
VLGAANVREALDLAERETFDLLISDIGLPDGSGIELLHRLQGRAPLKAIALSGYGMEDDVRRSHDAGFAAHLVKPVDFRQLQDLIEKLVGTT